MSTKTVRVFIDDMATRDHQATGWTVDEFGHLHVLGEKGAGNVATYRSGAWDSIETTSESQAPEAVGRIVVEAINLAASRAGRAGRA